MALVDYSDSDESDSEVAQQPKDAKPAAATTATSKKSFQKLIDKGKIMVQLPTAAGSTSEDAPEPPAKRAKTAAGGSSRFSSFGSFLPPPKAAAAATKALATKTGGSTLRPGVNLKTGAEPAFSRGGEDYDQAASSGPRKGPAGPSIPEGQKPESEIKFVGKPLMFKPLSVSRKPVKKKVPAAVKPGASGTSNENKAAAKAPEEQPQKKKVSLFSMGEEEEEAGESSAPSHSAAGASALSDGGASYEPMFGQDADSHEAEEASSLGGAYEYDDSSHYGQQQQQAATLAPTQQQPQSLSSIADGLELSAHVRRELFGRGGNMGNNNSGSGANARVINFNMEQEYENNEALRASGEQQVYNPVRAIAPGKHSLRQMVNMAQNNQTALQDSFAQGRNNRQDAASRYGWK
ncbi:mitotic checkpoint regulator, MAD2B-interacting-domain-containing protein [Lasiosphaeria miniovina]|uniref:Mitotic checkpoint regulator, MAD2B-interacting-domain-containing protein n=1 Tax=Lasiosphaeria miniovina TaxID=1954250 RepID=A0AA40AUY6_9PEZI|nr:mitotic checkpoint regulator, MAD2B-interacting-domain-containing protein [Lasiosphaeria miniovina]KAK0722414.1 mitotic checkpoint regulator, MAD2B-interacting-domain-containing protein [Lasiosphaeria miniovina]